ncbi:zinc finger associated protein [Popillia japonica]|uniref:Zinc finger associated protein n=1 Tax=Popillia japonica TaxID=7064 RepID=A0AAW1KM55_POPJA
MREIAAQGNIEEDALIDYVVDGIIDEEMNKTILYGAKSIGELKEKLKQYEKLKARQSRETKEFKERRSVKENEPRQTTSKYGEDKAIRCFSCGKIGHQSKNCYNKDKGLKCFACNEYGHISKDCRRKNTNQQRTDEGHEELDDLTLLKRLRKNHQHVSGPVRVQLSHRPVAFSRSSVSAKNLIPVAFSRSSVSAKNLILLDNFKTTKKRLRNSYRCCLLLYSRKNIHSVRRAITQFLSVLPTVIFTEEHPQRPQSTGTGVDGGCRLCLRRDAPCDPLPPKQGISALTGEGSTILKIFRSTAGSDVRAREDYRSLLGACMLRTPPKFDASNRYSSLTAGSPSATASDDELDKPLPDDEEETPKPPSSNFGELDALTNDEILKHIQLLQLLLQKRGFTTNPCNLSTEFSFTPKEAQVHSAGLTQDGTVGDAPRPALTPKRLRTLRSSDDPSQAPAALDHWRRPTEDIHKIQSADLQSSQRSQGPPSRRFPPLPSCTTGAPAAPRITASSVPTADQAHSGQSLPPPNDKIPPIVLRDKTKWAGASSEMKRKGLKFLKAQNIADGIRIFPATETDYRSITKFFDNETIPYHTYQHQVPSEKLLNVVFRGVPVEISEEELFNDLRERGFSPECVVRMRSSRNKAPMPLVLVKIGKEFKHIYHLKDILSLDITVETLNSRPTVGQCFRCQRFGHAQSRCTAPKKCVACAWDHDSYACPRPKQDPATCANCGEQHPANYRGCARFPKIRSLTPKNSATAGSLSEGGKSYSQAKEANPTRRPSRAILTRVRGPAPQTRQG